MTIRDFMNGMSEEQSEAARFTDEPVLTLAGAGSGKTRMLMGRFVHLVLPVKQGGLGADPGSIMMVTFTNRAAREMRERLLPLMDELREMGAGRGEPWLGTFHGLSLRILRIEADKAGLGSNFSIFDDSDARSLVNDVVEEMGIIEFDVDDFFRQLERAKAQMWEPEFLMSARDRVIASRNGEDIPGIRRWTEIMADFQSPDFIPIYARYQKALQEQNAVDFNDLLNRTTRMMQQSDEVRDSWRSSFRHYMVDEVQDINRAQVAWLNAMTDGGRKMEIPDHENVRTSEYGEASDGLHEINTYRLRKFPRPTVAFVGDDDQAIYGFRGSEVAVMQSLDTRFSGLEKKFLRTSYRCQQSILNASNSLVANNQDRFDKKLVACADTPNHGPVSGRTMYTPEDEIREIWREAKSYMEEGGNPSEFAILTRTRDLAKAVARAGRESGLPVVEGKSTDLRKTMEVRDIMGFVTWLINDDAEVVLRRIINRPARGLGPTSLRRVMQNARLKQCGFLEEFRSVMNGRIDIPEGGEPYRTAFVRSVREFDYMISELRGKVFGFPNASTALLAVMRQTGYLADLYHGALKSIGKAGHEAEVMQLEPRDFLQWVLRNQGDESDRLPEGEDLASRAAQLSESGRRIGNMVLLLEDAAEFDSLETFAQDSVLESGSAQASAGIHVMTIHGSKGLEFDHVRLPFWLEGVMPHGRAETIHDMEEERRLAYVALTRARHTVAISRPLSIRNCSFIRQKGQKASRFLDELKVSGWNNFRFLKRNDTGLTYKMAPVSCTNVISPPIKSLNPVAITEPIVNNGDERVSEQTNSANMSDLEFTGFNAGSDSPGWSGEFESGSELKQKVDSELPVGSDDTPPLPPMEAYEEELSSRPLSSECNDDVWDEPVPF